MDKSSIQVEQIAGPLVYCHCSFCRKATSSAFSITAMVDRKEVTILEGSGRLNTYQSSPGKTRYYCQNCHSQIYHVKDEQVDIITLKVGLLDNSQDLADLPHKHIHQDPDWAWLREE